MHCKAFFFRHLPHTVDRVLPFLVRFSKHLVALLCIVLALEQLWNCQSGRLNEFSHVLPQFLSHAGWTTKGTWMVLVCKVVNVTPIGRRRHFCSKVFKEICGRSGLPGSRWSCSEYVEAWFLHVEAKQHSLRRARLSHHYVKGLQFLT